VSTLFAYAGWEVCLIAVKVWEIYRPNLSWEEKVDLIPF
jgi:hypothetical protein